MDSEEHLSEAVATRHISTVRSLLQEDSVRDSIDEPGSDGTTPLCAAALWNKYEMVEILLEAGASVNAENSGTGWTPLHAAAFQEHGKVVKYLLESGADPEKPDRNGRTATDYASISQGIWSFFQMKGCKKTAKQDLVEKGIIRKIESNNNQVDDLTEQISHLSRPGSAYMRTRDNPMFGNIRPMRNGPIDPLSNDGSSSGQKVGNFQSLGL